MPNKANAVFDSESLKRQAREEQKELQNAARLELFCRQLDEAREVMINRYADFEHQQGRRLVAPILEQKIKKLCPNIVFMTRPLTDSQAAMVGLAAGSSVKSMDLLHPDGTHEPLCGFQNHPIIPEYTILLRRPVKIQNIFAKDVSWQDFPKARYIQQKDGSYKWEYDGPTPFEIMGTEPAGAIRGWRTLLARLVYRGLVTPNEAEREFGISDRKSWAVRMGKINESLNGVI